MTENKTVPVAVVGAGNMGLNHIRVYDELPEAELVGVVEPDEEAKKQVRRDYNIPVHGSIDEIQRAEAVTVSVPTEHHRKIAVSLIEMGIDILVEKPLAGSVEEAKKIVEAAKNNGSVLQVGHIERFNPAVQTLRKILEDEETVAFESHRLGPFNEHLSGENVVVDLMIHDIDVINSLTEGDFVDMTAMGTRTRSHSVDHAVAQLQYPRETMATLTASHVTHGKIRTLDVTTEDAYIQLDYQSQDLTIQRRGTEQTAEFTEHTGYVTETVTETPYVSTREPLKNELEHFLDCVRNDKLPEVDGEDGLKTLKIASEIAEKI